MRACVGHAACREWCIRVTHSAVQSREFGMQMHACRNGVGATSTHVSSTVTAGRDSWSTCPCVTSWTIDEGRKRLSFSDFFKTVVLCPCGRVTVSDWLSFDNEDKRVTASHSSSAKDEHAPPHRASVPPAAPKSRGMQRSARQRYVAGPDGGAGGGDGGDPPEAATVRVKNSFAIPPTVDSLPGSACWSPPVFIPPTCRLGNSSTTCFAPLREAAMAAAHPPPVPP
jgi:hypothetical protein